MFCTRKTLIVITAVSAVVIGPSFLIRSAMPSALNKCSSSSDMYSDLRSMGELPLVQWQEADGTSRVLSLSQGASRTWTLMQIDGDTACTMRNGRNWKMF